MVSWDEGILPAQREWRENGAALLPMAAQGCQRSLAPELLDAIHPADIKCAPARAKGASQVAQWKEPACQTQD